MILKAPASGQLGIMGKGAGAFGGSHGLASPWAGLSVQTSGTHEAHCIALAHLKKRQQSAGAALQPWMLSCSAALRGWWLAAVHGRAVVWGETWSAAAWRCETWRAT